MCRIGNKNIDYNCVCLPDCLHLRTYTCLIAQSRIKPVILFKNCDFLCTIDNVIWYSLHIRGISIVTQMTQFHNRMEHFRSVLYMNTYEMTQWYEYKSAVLMMLLNKKR